VVPAAIRKGASFRAADGGALWTGGNRPPGLRVHSPLLRSLPSTSSSLWGHGTPAFPRCTRIFHTSRVNCTRRRSRPTLIARCQQTSAEGAMAAYEMLTADGENAGAFSPWHSGVEGTKGDKTMDLPSIGPRTIPVVREGNRVLVNGVENGRFFSTEIGQMSPCPFDNTVRDWRGRPIGKLEGRGIIGPHTLVRW